MDTETKHLRIHGRVQGVGYRNWAQYTAVQLRLCGWVRNVRKDSSVEIIIKGDEDNIQKFISAAYQGPSGCKVEAIHVSTGVNEDFTTFEIRDTL
jgi:acylphosphatase